MIAGKGRGNWLICRASLHKPTSFRAERSRKTTIQRSWSAASSLYYDVDTTEWRADGTALGCREGYETMTATKREEKERLFCGDFRLTGAPSVSPVKSGSFRGSQVDGHSDLKIIGSTDIYSTQEKTETSSALNTVTAYPILCLLLLCPRSSASPDPFRLLTVWYLLGIPVTTDRLLA